MMNDLLGLAIARAVDRFGGDDGLFTGATLSEALCHLARISGPIDGALCRVLVTGRPEVQILGGGYYRRVHVSLKAAE